MKNHDKLGSIEQNVSHAYGILTAKGEGGGGGWVNLLKKENLWRKSFFSDNVQWSFESL